MLLEREKVLNFENVRIVLRHLKAAITKTYIVSNSLDHLPPWINPTQRVGPGYVA